MNSFEVHSNESACRKSDRLGLEQVYIHTLELIIFFIQLSFSIAYRYIIQFTNDISGYLFKKGTKLPTRIYFKN